MRERGRGGVAVGAQELKLRLMWLSAPSYRPCRLLWRLVWLSDYWATLTLTLCIGCGGNGRGPACITLTLACLALLLPSRLSTMLVLNSEVLMLSLANFIEHVI